MWTRVTLQPKEFCSGNAPAPRGSPLTLRPREAPSVDSAALPETNAPAVPVRPTPVPVLVSAGSAPNPAPVVPAPAVVPSAANPALVPDGSAHVSTGPSMVEARPEGPSPTALFPKKAKAPVFSPASAITDPVCINHGLRGPHACLT